MPAIAVVNQKGGCGKSTVAGHLIRWLHGKGHTVALIDADAQQSSSMWINAIASNESGKFFPTVEVWGTADEILEGLPEVVSKHD
jgi:chromosome partitioning protein